MKILLVNPPFQRLKGFENLHFHLGLGYIAAVIDDERFEVRIYDAELPHRGDIVKPADQVSQLMEAHHEFIGALNNSDHRVWKQVSNVLESFKPDIVGISVMTPIYGSARKISSLCKQFNSKTIVVWGGVHPTVMAEEVLQQEKDVDFAVRGEGEFTFKELVTLLGEGSREFHRIKGLSYRSSDGIMHNEPRELIENIDDIPFPRRDLLLNEILDNRVFRNIMGSRGCPYNCGYCSSRQLWARKVRFRSIPGIISEIRYIADHYDLTELSFFDDSFTLKKKWTRELCKSLLSEKLYLSWWCNTRANLLDEETIKLMKKAGCTALNIGVETGSEKTLAYLNRKLTLKDIYNASDLLRKCGIDWYAYFMIGFPLETTEDIDETRKLMHKLSASLITLSIFNPYPGSELYALCRKEGLLPDKPDWSKFSHQSPENHFVKNISKEDFTRIVREVMEECDRINKSFGKKLYRLILKRKYYFRHPGVLLDKIKKLI